MKNNDLNNLINELKAEGASEKEAEELFLFSKNMGNLLNIERSDELKNKFLTKIVPQQKIHRKMYYFATIFSIILLLGFSSVVEAQKSIPGDTLYPVKIASESVVKFIDPSFKSEVLKRRSKEIKDLSGKNKSVEFHKTVKVFEKELSENKDIDVKDIEESRKNLEEAKREYLEEDTEDLEKVIMQTKDVQELLEKTGVRGDQTGPSEEEKKDNEGSNNKTEEEQLNSLLEK